MRFGTPRLLWTAALAAIVLAPAVRVAAQYTPPRETFREDVSEMERLLALKPSPEQYRRASEELAAMTRRLQASKAAGNRTVQSLASSVWIPIGLGIHDSDEAVHKAGRVNCVAVAYDEPQGQTTYWAGASSGGLWKFIKSADRWQCVSDSLKGSPSVGAFLVKDLDSSTILIGTGDATRYGGDGMYKTKDGGTTWKYVKVDAGGAIPSYYYSILQDNGDATGRTVVAANSQGIYRSKDFGDTWTQVYAGGCTSLIQAPGGGVDLPGIYYAGRPGSGVLESTDGGQSFHLIGGGGGVELGVGLGGKISRLALTVCASDPNYLYCLIANEKGELNGIYRSSDKGYHWVNIVPYDGISGVYVDDRGQGGHACAIAVDPDDKNHVIAGIAGCIESINAASTDVISWNDFQVSHPDQHAFLFLPQTHNPDTHNLLVANDGGFYVKDLIGGACSGAHNLKGLNIAQVGWQKPNGSMAGAPTAPNILLSGLFDNGMVYTDTTKTPDAANHELGGGDGGFPSFSPADPNIFVFGSGEPFNRWYTRPGAEWQDINFTLDSTGHVPPIGIDPRQGLFGLVFTFWPEPMTFEPVWHLFYKPLDATTDWTDAGARTDLVANRLDIAMDPSTYHIYVTGDGSRKVEVYEGVNPGTMTLSDRTPTLPAMTSDSAAALVNADKSVLQPQTVYYATAFSRPSRVFFSTTAGKSVNGAPAWKDVSGDLVKSPGNPGLPDADYYKLIGNPGNLNQLFLATNVGIFRSDTGGKHWYPFMFGLPAQVDVADIVINYDHADPPVMHIGTFGRGWYERQIVAGLSAATISPTLLPGGKDATVTLTLSGKAPVGGKTFRVTTAVPGVTVPATVMVPEGGTSKQFAVQTSPVASFTSGAITISDEDMSQDVMLNLRPPYPTSLQVTPLKVEGGAQNAAGAVTLEAPTAENTPVTVTITAGASAVSSISNGIAVSAGQTQANFTVYTNFVLVSTAVTLKATVNGKSVSRTFYVYPPKPKSVTFSPATVTGGQPSTGTVNFVNPLPFDWPVTISVVDGASVIATIDPSTKVLAGNNKATFNLTTSAGDVTALPWTVTAKIRAATTSGYATGSLKVVKASVPATLTFTPSLIANGAKTTVTVTLDSAPLTDSYVDISLPGLRTASSQIKVTHGQKSGSIPATAFGASGRYTGTATLNGVTASGNYAIQ